MALFNYQTWASRISTLSTDLECLVLLSVQNDFGPSKSFWLSTNRFGRVQFFWLGPNHFGQVQIIKISPEKFNLSDPYQNTLDSNKMIWTRPKWLVLNQNNLNGPNSYWSYRRTGHQSKFQSGDVNRRILSELVTHLFKIYILFFSHSWYFSPYLGWMTKHFY